MMDRVSTYNLHQVAVSSALNVQSQLAQAQLQEASGLVATDYGTLGGQKSYQLLNLQSELSKAQTWSTEAGTIGDRTQSMYSAVGSMTSVLTKLETAISGALSSTDTSTLTTTVGSLMDQLVSAMNTKSGERYVFSGSNISTAPVDMSSYAPASQSSTTTPAYDPTVQDFSYYKGDNADLSVQVDATTTVTYGIRAGTTNSTTTTADPAAGFELAIRATEAAKQAGSTSPVDTTMLQKAFDLSQSAMTSLSNLQETIAATSSQLSSVQSTQTNYATLLQSSVTNLKDIDTATVTTQIAQYQTQLQASYMAVASITKLNLASYL